MTTRIIAGSPSALGALAMALTCAAQTADFPLQDGEAVVTCFSGYNIPFDPSSGVDPDGFVTAVVDVRLPPVSGPFPLLGTAWAPPDFHNEIPFGAETWTAQNLGQVFGVCLDDAIPPNIYVTATTAYGAFAPGPAGPGGVYRLDGTTGAISDLCTTGAGGIGSTEIDNSGSGLGNICYDATHQQLFVTNHEDGSIWRLDLTGVVLSIFDPFDPDPGDPGFAKRGERLWGLQVLEDRLYFSMWLRDSANQFEPWPSGAGVAPPDPNNSVWSVALDGTGEFLGAEQLEIVLPYLNAIQLLYSNPVSDIAFDDAGKMLLGERTMIDDVGQIDIGHLARCVEYCFDSVGGSWVPSVEEYWIGGLINITTGSPLNCAGGVDYECDGDIWSTGDVILPGMYGIQWISSLGNTPAYPVQWSYLVPLDPGLKSGIGDVEIKDADCMPPGPCEVTCPADAIMEGEPCGLNVINPGCDAVPPLFSQLGCDEKVCGQLWADMGVADSDWYEVKLFDTDGDGEVELCVTLTSEMPATVRIYMDDCNTLPLLAETESIACLSGSVCICLPAPATYFVEVRPGTIAGGPIVDGFPCDSDDLDYLLEIACNEPCESPCGDPMAGPCNQPNGTPGCDDAVCCNLVCQVDPTCCTVAWDAPCVTLAF